MNEYIPREAVMKIIGDIPPIPVSDDKKIIELHSLFLEIEKELKEAISKIPAADVREVVRCSECKHCTHYTNHYGNVSDRYRCKYGCDWCDEDFYCRYGEKICDSERM